MVQTDLRIRIIGAGMGGLACALSLAKAGFLDIQVYESASGLGFVGAGIQLAPNLARILDRLGAWGDIRKEASLIHEARIIEGTTDEPLGHVDMAHVEEMYQYPHCVGHRASLANSMYEACKGELGVKFVFGTKVDTLDTFLPVPSFMAIPRTGTEPYRVEVDVLLACDGVKSYTRHAMLESLGLHAQVEDTGQAAYRIMIPRKLMAGDKELLDLINGDQITRWVGAGRHIIAYPVSNKNIYNLSTVQPDNNFAAAPSETYTTKGSKDVMLNVFSDFCPRVQRMLDLVPEGEVCEWKLRVHAPLQTWVHGSVALVGDACHPTLPHLNQGAAQAIEDGAVLGVVLSKLPDSSPRSIYKALKIYEDVRKDRAETLINLAAQSGRDMHLAEGEAKAERDHLFAALKLNNGKGPSPDKWADADIQRMIYGHDCVKEADKVFERSFYSHE
ncbi:MAG: hypothetical protein M1828_006193 [Chrysothrix sp. TS-e1954]|nr:MAG: hypothetical protein M1828_006193 [Chrysothrix sp. TS-e1954]